MNSAHDHAHQDLALRPLSGFSMQATVVALRRLPRKMGLGLLGVLFSASAAAQAAPAAPAKACSPLLDRQALRLQDEKPQDLCQYAGKVILVVNTASRCGFTHQYTGLETIYARYKDQGLVVLGFPSNDFGQQEPGSAKEIADFCENTYGVKFPMFSKTQVKPGAGQSPLYAELARRTGELPGWNFHKYLIARDGSTVTSYGSMTSPESRTMVKAIEGLLAQR